MKTKTYVSVNDKWFSQKISYALPKTPIDKIKENNDDENNQIDVRRNNVISKLPRLFKRINTYYNA